MRATAQALCAMSVSVFCLLLGVGSGLAEAGPLRDRIKARMAERAEEAKVENARPIDLQTILPGSQKLTQEYQAGSKQVVDVYIPPGARSAPLIVMIHGGAWKVGDKANTNVVENKLKHWLPMGFILVSVNYRLLPEAMAYEQAEDVAVALGWIQSHAADWGGDTGKIILMGHSAGGHIAALLSSKPEMVAQRWAGTIVLDSAILEVSDTMKRRHLGFYDEAFGGDPAYWVKSSPMDQWTPTAVTMMLVCSTQRRDAPCDAAKSFQAIAMKAGIEMPVLPQNLNHGEINKTLGLPGQYTEAIDGFIKARFAAVH